MLNTEPHSVGIVLVVTLMEETITHEHSELA